MVHKILPALMAAVAVSPALSMNVSNVFGDHAVLQRNKPATVWGWTNAGATVSLPFNSATYKGVADTTGLWRITLPAQPASGSFNLNFSSSDGTSAQLHDILFGEVYVCSGQSNMVMSISAVFNGSAEIAIANNYPNIRLFTVGQGTQSSTPLPYLHSIEQPWTLASNISLSNGDDFGYFSAVCWYFAKDVHDALGGKVAVGLVSTNWGGTEIEIWSPPSALKVCNTSGSSPLWNAMVEPFTVGPMAISGFTWYQGEANADNNETVYYACAFPAMIEAWRTAFQQGNLWFGFVQLAAYVQDAKFAWQPIPYLRQSQLAGLQQPSVHVATAIDLGDAEAPHGSVHPRNKAPVGARLAAGALAMQFGQKVPYLSPRYASAQDISTATALKAQVNFVPGTAADGLKMVPISCPSDVPSDECDGFSVYGTDGMQYNATATINADGQSITLIATGAPAGVRASATRYGFSPWPLTSLYTTAGFPALGWWETVA